MIGFKIMNPFPYICWELPKILHMPIATLRNYFFLYFLFCASFGNAQKETEQKCMNIHNRYLDEIFQLTRNCVGFSAPVSARAYSYFSIGMYESTVELFSELNSLDGQLVGYQRTKWSEDTSDYYWPLVVNSVNFELSNYLYRIMPPDNLKKLNTLSDSVVRVESTQCSKDKAQKSTNYGKQIAVEIINWSKGDGADNAFYENYPESYEPPKCLACWTKTTPGYLPSLLPFWGNNRTMFSGSHQLVSDFEVLEFTKDSTSLIYKDALEVLSIGLDKNPEYEIIAEYWDDGPGYSGTPPGHFFCMAKQLIGQKNLRVDQTLELYAKLGIALNESFITCWRLKFTHNFIRPITYIHRYIASHFNTRIDTPSFPESPSGHSFQSGAGAEVLISFFGNEIQFIDSTNFYRNDIDGSPRSFSSITQLSKEISNSRLYGGIHFRTTLNTSLSYGRKVGQYVLHNLKLRNE